MRANRAPSAGGAEREIDQLDVMDGHVGSWIAALDPLGELLAADLLRFEQRAIAVVDVASTCHRRRMCAVSCDPDRPACDRRPWPARSCRRARACSSSSSCKRNTDGFSMRTCLPASRARRAASKWRLSGVAMQTRSIGSASNRPMASFPAQLTNGPSRPAALCRRRSPRIPVRLATADSSTFTKPKSRLYIPSLMELFEKGTIGLLENHAQSSHASA